MENNEKPPTTATKFWCFFAPLLSVESIAVICWGFKNWWLQAYIFATMLYFFGAFFVPFVLGLFSLILVCGKPSQNEEIVGRYGLAGSGLAFVSGAMLFIVLTSNPAFR